MKPGPEKEFTESLVIAVNKNMKEFLAAESKLQYPNTKRGAMGSLVRQYIINGWVAANIDKDKK